MKSRLTFSTLLILLVAAVFISSPFSAEEGQSQTRQTPRAVTPVPRINPASSIQPVPRLDPVPQVQTAPRIETAPSIEPAPRVQPAPRVDTLPTVIVPGPTAPAERETPDCSVRGFACAKACDPLPQGWSSYRACLRYECKQVDENCLEKLAEELDSRTSNQVTFNIECMDSQKIQIEFYSQDRNVAWPGNDRVYNIDDCSVHMYKLKCNSGEKICYGAWSVGGSKYWGLGMNDRSSCDNCCRRCDGGSYSYVLQ